MAAEKKYFHDKLVLLLLSVNAFMAILGSILVLLKIGNSTASTYIIQNRTNLPYISEYKNGTATSLYAFIVFIVFVLVFHSVLSFKTYNLRRDYSVAILGIGLILIVFSIVVSYSLLALP
jgi:hypothetical protein